jgi:hypothetical protein
VQYQPISTTYPETILNTFLNINKEILAHSYTNTLYKTQDKDKSDPMIYFEVYYLVGFTTILRWKFTYVSLSLIPCWIINCCVCCLQISGNNKNFKPAVININYHHFNQSHFSYCKANKFLFFFLFLYRVQ